MRIFYKDTITAERLNPNIYGTKESYAALGTLLGMVLTISPQDAMISDGNISQSSSLICEPTIALQVSDRVTINGEKYIVRGVKKPSGNFSIEYQRAVIEKLNS
jgi:hypothetical protein